MRMILAVVVIYLTALPEICSASWDEYFHFFNSYKMQAFDALFFAEKKDYQFQDGEMISIKLKAHSSVRGVEVARIFTLASDKNIPSIIDTKENCNIYQSIIISLDARMGLRFDLTKASSAWLDWDDEYNAVKPGRYLVVFESNGPNNNVIGLHPNDALVYFKYGIIITINPGRSSVNSDVKKAYFERKNKFARLELEKGPCYKLKTGEDVDIKPLMAELVVCRQNDES